LYLEPQKKGERVELQKSGKKRTIKKIGNKTFLAGKRGGGGKRRQDAPFQDVLAVGRGKGKSNKPRGLRGTQTIFENTMRKKGGNNPFIVGKGWEDDVLLEKPKEEPAKEGGMRMKKGERSW